MHCPSCGSTNVKKSAAVYEQGTSHTDHRGGGYWASSRGNVGAWSRRGGSTRSTGSAQRNAPPLQGWALPVTAAAGLGLVGTIILGVSISMNITTLIVLAPLVSLGAASTLWHLTTDERARADKSYARQWYCLRCGTLFHKSANESGAGSGASPAADPPPNQPFSSARDQYRSNSKRRAYAARIVSPVQRARAETDRDASGLLSIADRADAGGTFDPQRPTDLDLGLVSRLASLGYLRWTAPLDEFALTTAGQKRTANLRSHE